MAIATATPTATGTSAGALAPAGSALPMTTGATAQVRALLAQMTGLQRAAAFLIGIGPEASAVVLKQLRDEDIERVMLEISRMRQVNSKVTDALLEEVYNSVVAADFASAGGLDYAQELLTRTLGPQRAAELISRLSARVKAGPFDFLREVDSTQLVSLIQGEHPQTIALILSNIAQGSPEQAAQVLTALSPETQADVTMRIARMDRTAPEVVKEVERLIKKKVSAFSTQGKQVIDGLKVVVNMLNQADQSSSKAIVDQLDESYPELADEIKKNMFVFTDIVRLNDRDMPRVMREVETKELAIALKGASDELRAKFMGALSKRAAADLQDNIEISGPQRLATVEEAQQKIVAVIRRLEQAEEITISRGGKDDMVL